MTAVVMFAAGAIVAGLVFALAVCIGLFLWDWDLL